MEKVWLITGCSAGFGKELVSQLLVRNENVVATARNISSLDEFPESDNLLKISLDITKKEQISTALETTLARFGRIDVLINNAGYGLAGALEEVSEEELREQFETNVFGTLALTRAVLPTMRNQQSGVIQVLSSVAGLIGNPGLGAYNGSKFALEGIFEALSQEVAPFGIHVSIIEPGPFRTAFAGSSLKVATAMDVYAENAGKIRQYFEKVNGQQIGDPVKAAEAMIHAAEMPEPPLRLLLGKIAVRRYREKLERELANIATYEETSLACDFPA